MAGLILLLVAAGPVPQAGGRVAPTNGDTRTARALMAEGIELLKANRVPDAAARFTEAIQHEPNLAEAHYYLGVAREQQQDGPGAEAEYRRAVALAPMALAHDRLGFVL